MGTRNNPSFMLSVLFLCFTLNIRLFFGADTISANQPLSADQTIVSSGGIFELGFFTPGKSSNFYIGIWYKKVSEQTIVWVANRDTPVSDKYSSELKILDGNLVLVNESQTLVWTTNLSSTISNSLVAILRDDGNFVFGDAPNVAQPIWQSFDHPAHTFLPGNKIGFNKLTNKNQLLTSWKNSENPTAGQFSLELDPNGSQYLIWWNRSVQYWTSGVWNGHIFSLIPEMRLNYIYNFSYVTNENESYFTYSLYNPSIISRCILDFSGQIKQLTWLETTKEWNLFWSQPREQCEVNAYCGAFGACSQITRPFCDCLYGFSIKYTNDWNLSDYSSGCVRKTNLQCGTANGEEDRFRENPHMGLPQNPQSVPVGNDAECKSACLNNCSCTAYAYDDNECSIWIGDLLDLKQLSKDDVTGRTLYVRLAASEFSNDKDNKRVIIGSVVGSVAVLIVLGIVFVVIVRRKRRSVGTAKIVEGSLVAFGYKNLQIATKNFSENLGGGGFGSLSKGTLPDSSVIAVKKLESTSQGEKQFRTEVCTIGAIRHVNLVRLRGFCSEGDKRLLVYDYMPNGSLDSHLFHEKDSNYKVLDWKTRYQIALGTARGLDYLHEKCWDCIIHCDVKPENIFLDADFCPKVADFGLAKLLGREFSRVLTTMKGTRGYLAPEWMSDLAITAKADVYSYGMMLFEFVSGRRNSEQSQDGKIKFFPAWAASVIAEGAVFRLLDPRLEGNADAEEVSRICRVACWCIQDDENHRPSMGLVVQILEGILDVNLPPIPRSLQMLVDSQEHTILFTESSSSQEHAPLLPLRPGASHY
ncbi:G-type lectin S-receptor-like serine/threonine-protein kinase At2g19130 [Cornus florida]|uniref:G-type lectin S-receptor-like serine/threonine-protein kinase At2g19130 n=1 Tax=Cornus florida TaxID=4283 RepID=UPI00289A6EEB|nr:G-type lectin S-receptor-like serine/threonine-protein kinase At2g19130 [Cornus florida]